jgi:hypothetical protein
MIRSLIIAFLGVGAGLILGLSSGERRGGEGAGSEGDEAKLIGRAVSVVSTGVDEAGVGEPSADAGDDALKAYLEKLAEEHPAEAIAWVRRNEKDGERDELFRLIAERWAMGEPEAAFLWAAGLKRADERGAAYLGAVEGALKSGDQVKAFGMIEQIPMGRLRDGVLEEAVGIMAETDVAMAFELAGQIGESYRRSGGLGAIVTKMIETGRVEEAKAMVMRMPTPHAGMDRKIVYALVKAMAIENPSQALQWVADETDLLEGSMARMMAYRFAGELVREDPLEAIAWGDKLPEGYVRDGYYGSVGYAWAKAEPEAAGDWMVKAINERGYQAVDNMAGRIFQEWVDLDQERPFESIGRIEDGEERNRAMATAMMELARDNPARAAERLEEWEPADKEKAIEISDRLMDSWMGRDAEAASDWLNTLAPGEVKDAAISELVESVARDYRDFAGARAWVNEAHSEKVRESLTRVIERWENR